MPIQNYRTESAILAEQAVHEARVLDEAAQVEERYRMAEFLDDFRASYGVESTHDNSWETE